MIPLKIHNGLDYLIGAFVMLAPWVFAMDGIVAARATCVGLGFLMILYATATNYHYSLARLLPLGAHMTIDVVVGIALILAPSLLGYRRELADGQYAAHVMLGIGTIALVALTRPRTEAAKTPVERAEIAHDLG